MSALVRYPVYCCWCYIINSNIDCLLRLLMLQLNAIFHPPVTLLHYTRCTAHREQELGNTATNIFSLCHRMYGESIFIFCSFHISVSRRDIPPINHVLKAESLWFILYFHIWRHNACDSWDIAIFEGVKPWFLRYCDIAGGCCGSTSKKTVVGGWAWAWWLVTDVQRYVFKIIN